jgi:hypothetical protein
MNWIKKLLALTRRPELSADHPWSQSSMATQRARGRYLHAAKESAAFREGFEHGRYQGALDCTSRVAHEHLVLRTAGLVNQARVAKDLSQELDALVRRYEPRKGS